MPPIRDRPTVWRSRVSSATLHVALRPGKEASAKACDKEQHQLGGSGTLTEKREPD
jgi:hypothetical protein